MEPISASVVFASIGSAYKFADLAIRLAEVGSENEVFVRTIHVVREDLNEVSRLLSIESIRGKLASIPGKLPWIRGAVTNTKTALNDIGKAIERVRVEKQATGSVKFETRVRWVFNDHEKILNRTSELTICHQQLSNVLSYLVRLEDIPVSAEPPVYHDATYFDDLITRHRRRTFSKSSENVAQSQRLPSHTECPETVQSGCSVGNAVDIKQAPISHSLQHDAPLEVSSTPHEQMHAASSAVKPQATLPPYSPPPIYVLAAQLRPTSSRHSFGNNKHTGEKYLDQGRSDSTSELASTGAWLPSGTEETKTSVYRHSQGGMSSSGLEGNFLGLTAANIQGPVDPFDFNPNPQPPVGALVPNIEDTKWLPELQGDPQLSGTSAMDTDSNVLELLSIGEPGSINGTEEFAGASVHRAVSHCDPLSASPTLSVAASKAREKTTMDTSKHNIPAVELASWPDTPLKPEVFYRDGPKHRSNTLVPSVSLPKTSVQYQAPQPGFPGQTGPSLSRSRSASDLDRQSRYCKPQTRPSITRMRSQRHMMALLGSIET